MNQSLMAAEVNEIPQAVARFLERSAPMVAQAAAAVRRADPRFALTVARGSSDHAATYLKYAIELMSGLPVASVGPSVASIYRRPLRVENALCIGISQSGQSPDIVEMMRALVAGGGIGVAITNSAESPMATASAHCLPLQAGPERSVAATKTFVCSVVAGLALLAEWQEDRPLQQALRDLPAALDQALTMDWSALSARLARAGSLYVLGRGPAFSIACEAALKFKEICGLHAESYSAAEVLHGPSAIVQAGFPILALGVPDAALPQVTVTAERLAAQGAEVFLTGPMPPDAQAKGCVLLPSVEGLHPMVAPLVLAASFYRMAEELARRRGFNPDTPPHLRKVTETV